jgi:hypothetical protein
MNRLPVDWRAPTQPLFDQTPTEPFVFVAPLERRIERLEAENAALREDQTSLCDLHKALCEKNADLMQTVARLEQELAQLKRVKSRGEYRLQRPVVDHFGAMRVRP